MSLSEQELLKKLEYYGTRYEQLRLDYEILMRDMSTIDYLCGEPNEMLCSDYDLHADSSLVIGKVAAMAEELRYLRSKMGSSGEA